MEKSLSSPRLPTLIPYLTVQNALAAIQFYEKAFGFVWKNASEHSSKEDIQHVEMIYQDVYIMFAPEGAFGSPAKAPATLNIPSPMTLYLYCNNVDHLYQQAINAGAKPLLEPHDSFWGDRVCHLGDPDGYHWMFATPLPKE